MPRGRKIPKGSSKIKTLDDYKGSLEKIEGLYLVGLAFNQANPQERVELIVLVDGKPVCEGIADEFRTDLYDLGIGDGKYGFKIQLPDTYADGKEHEVRVVVKNTGKDLDKSPQKITIKPVEDNYIGTLDEIDGLIVRGWAYNKNNPEERVEVVVLVDSKPVAEVVADQYREDLKQSGIGDGKHAFSIKLPHEIGDGKKHKFVIVTKNFYIFIAEKIEYTKKIVFNDNLITIDDSILNNILTNNKSNEPYINKNFIESLINGDKVVPVHFFNESHLESLVYFELGKQFAIKKNTYKAEGFYTLALDQCKTYTGIFLEHLANLYNETGLEQHAKTVYEQSISYNTTIFVDLALCEMYINQDRYKKAIKILKTRINDYPTSASSIMVRIKLDNLLEQYYNYIVTKLLRSKIYSNIVNKKEILEWLITEFNFIYETYKDIYYLKEKENENKNLVTNKVLIIAGSMDLSQCKRYRIDQKLEQFKIAGIEVEVIPYNEVEFYFDKIQEYDFFIFYRLPVTYNILKFVAKVNCYGKISIFEIDDLIFDIDVYPPPIKSFGWDVDIHLYRSLEYGMYLFNCMARFCKYGLVSTNLLSEKLKTLIKSNTVFIHKNAIDSQNLFLLPISKKNSGKVKILYGSGTLAHNQDFIDLALPALDKILGEYPYVELIVVGYLNLTEKFLDKYKDRVQLVPYRSLRDYYLLLSQADINLAVLYDGEFEGCKSELKWIEAACVGVPSVVSSTVNYREIIRHGEDGFIAKNWKDFYKYLKLLTENEDLRVKIAKNAQMRVRKEYSLNIMAQNLKGTIESINQIERQNENNSQISSKKKKIAIVNAFFPPELIGGGTIIAYENFLVLKRDYQDMFNICVFTSEAHYLENYKPYTLEQYIWMDSNVYKIYPNFKNSDGSFKQNFEWEYYDEMIKKVFRKFLDKEKPHIIHFHAIQRLTGSIVEACIDYGIPYIITTHDAWWISDWMFLTDSHGDVYPEGFPDLFSERPLPKGVSLYDSISRLIFLNYLAQNSAYFYTVSSEFATLYKNNRISNVNVIENGISEFTNFVDKDTSYTNKVVLGFSSAFAIHKGYDLLHFALERIKPKNIEVVLVDYSKPENFLRFGFIGEVPVRLVGSLEFQRINNFYKQIDVLIHPSKWPESYGLAIREALMCGCSVVVSSRIGALNNLTNREGVYIVDPNLDQLAEIIAYIDNNPKKFKKLIKSNKNLRKISEQVKELVKVYNNVLN